MCLMLCRSRVSGNYIQTAGIATTRWEQSQIIGTWFGNKRWQATIAYYHIANVTNVSSTDMLTGTKRHGIQISLYSTTWEWSLSQLRVYRINTLTLPSRWKTNVENIHVTWMRGILQQKNSLYVLYILSLVAEATIVFYLNKASLGHSLSQTINWVSDECCLPYSNSYCLNIPAWAKHPTWRGTWRQWHLRSREQPSCLEHHPFHQKW